MLIKNIALEFTEDSTSTLHVSLFIVLDDPRTVFIVAFQKEGKSILPKLLLKYPPEVDASQLQKILKSNWKSYLCEKPSLELCKSLIMLKDYNISGRINLIDIPALIHMLQFWRVSFLKNLSFILMVKRCFSASFPKIRTRP